MQRYVPSEAIAREALVSALDAWRRGDSPERVDSGSRDVQVADTHRQPGQTLADYEILGETAMDGGRRYAVRLRLESPAAVQKAHYVVLGIDPVWVFRQEDYDMIAHWDHPMAPEGAEGPPDAEPPSSAADGPRSKNNSFPDGRTRPDAGP
jgi:hypothetical protein